ncbi:hypothetical protein Hokovirus_1_218 [Hokovirus HKV1]|uniref:Uncharacterized protein n=1 Tax=Hokovirus HKV1 TaxID=1977638 RepID=A0A1V0SF41_9VIRU|nr:hypothetical protein Hokovirus_1_218 [Hokovirus HKV1]
MNDTLYIIIGLIYVLIGIVYYINYEVGNMIKILIKKESEIINLENETSLQYLTRIFKYNVENAFNTARYFIFMFLYCILGIIYMSIH